MVTMTDAQIARMEAEGWKRVDENIATNIPLQVGDSVHVYNPSGAIGRMDTERLRRLNPDEYKGWWWQPITFEPKPEFQVDHTHESPINKSGWIPLCNQCAPDNTTQVIEMCRANNHCAPTFFKISKEAREMAAKFTPETAVFQWRRISQDRFTASEFRTMMVDKLHARVRNQKWEIEKLHDLRERDKLHHEIRIAEKDKHIQHLEFKLERQAQIHREQIQGIQSGILTIQLKKDGE